jgi:hypothetical protein
MRTGFYFFLLLLSSVTFGQKKATILTKLPFTRHSGGVVMINAQLSGVPDTLTFILDTGSGGISIDSSLCAINRLLLTEGDTVVLGIGGSEAIPMVLHQSLFVSSLEIKNLDFRVYNYSALSEIYGTQIDGVLGYDFFSKYIININYDDQTVEILSKGNIKYPSGGFVLHTGNNTLPINKTELKGKRKIVFPLFLDTGAGLPLLLNDNFVKDSSLLNANKKVFTTRAAGFGGKKQVLETVIKKVKLGPYSFYNVPTFLFNDNEHITQYPYSGGLLGSELLQKFNIIINYEKKEFFLKPNTQFDAPFDYGYSGAIIIVRNNKIIVEDVVENSPAAISGISVGDEIIGVDNNLTGDLEAVKLLFQDYHRQHFVIIKRYGELMSFTLKPISIL